MPDSGTQAHDARIHLLPENVEASAAPYSFTYQPDDFPACKSTCFLNKHTHIFFMCVYLEAGEIFRV